MIDYHLPGSRDYQERLYPNPRDLNPALRAPTAPGVEPLDSYEAVIKHFTASSLRLDGIDIVDGSLVVRRLRSAGYAIRFKPLPASAQAAGQFAFMHVAMLDERHAGLALAGADACRRTPAWNPMAGFPVNKHDGPSIWTPCLPLGLPLSQHRAVTLMHYPPIVAYKNADYLDNMTLRRWAQLLLCAGVEQPERYHSILDVNPIAAPGSGESEYPNDYFPINLTSLFFDNSRRGLNYVRAMLELSLNPPANDASPYTLPLLVCGSPLYDPQAPGWFRTRYKEQLPKDANGTPTVDAMQVGLVKLNPRSRKLTPYMVANHMIAAGVTGQCTQDASRLPDILQYEAQDLVAASFVTQYGQCAPGEKLEPADAKGRACQRWFGNPDGRGAPAPPSAEDQLTLCALAQMDLCFDPKNVAPMYTYAQAQERCRSAGGKTLSPCFGCLPLAR